tara:strand:+ start:962 stop:1687 length:726 start_codon:yes stop_codon:yes gene_type:complete
MVSVLLNLWISFLAGLFAPLGAVCVLPLYPGFLAYLAGQLKTKQTDSPEETDQQEVIEKDQQKKIIIFGFVVAGGILLSMFLFGLIFTFFLQKSLTKVIGIVSPIAFGLLAVISIFLIFNFNFGQFIPKLHSPVKKNPYWSSLLFGLFFGAIVLPCNPASLAVLFAISTSITEFLINLINFLFFGLGMALPLIVLAFVSAAKSGVMINFLTKQQRKINLIAGIIMLLISLYYLFFVFKIFG